MRSTWYIFLNFMEGLQCICKALKWLVVVIIFVEVMNIKTICTSQQVFLMEQTKQKLCKEIECKICDCRWVHKMSLWVIHVCKVNKSYESLFYIREEFLYVVCVYIYIYIYIYMYIYIYIYIWLYLYVER